MLQWLEEVFLPYLEAWERSVECREGFTAAQKQRMLLSSETRLGLKMTGIIHDNAPLTKLLLLLLFQPSHLWVWCVKYSHFLRLRTRSWHFLVDA